MIELVTIEVTNFRSFSHALLAPLGYGQGMTAINGPNGSGKSSIATHALLWCLYGVTPDGVPVKGLRRQESEGEVRVAVTFRHDGQTIEVERALRGKNDTTVAAITVDGVEQTNVSAKTATGWVTARLGVDAEGFTTAFVVRQKEVDALVTARPAERRTLIERLAGIEKMSQALTKAREHARTASAAAAALATSTDPQVARQTAHDAREHAEAQAETAVTRSQQASDAQKAADEAADAVTDAQTRHDTLTTARHALEMADQRLDAARREHDRTLAAAAGADLLPDLQAQAARRSEERGEAQATIAAVEAAEADARRADTLAAHAAADADTAAAAEEAARTDLAAAHRPLDTIPDTIEDSHAAAVANLDAATTALGAAEGEAARLSRAIQALEITITAGHGACPTCASELPDASALLADMRTDAATVADTITGARQRVADLRAQVRTLAGDAEARRAAQGLVNAAQKALTDAETVADTAREKALRAGDAAETAAENAHAARLAAADAEAGLPDLIAAEKAASTALRRAETAAEAEEALPAAAAALETATTAQKAAAEDASSAQSAARGLDLAALRTRSIALSEAARTAEQAAGTARQAAVLAERDAADAERDADAAEQAADARKQALAEAEVAAHVASALEEFRRDRIARLAPELSEVASDIVATMTEGRYTSVDLDEEFTPVLTEAATGLERPVAWLSGGEVSVVALALRIAIGEVVAGQRGGLLVLDEALTAQDPGRRGAVMSAIRTLSRQVITINHVSEATDMVDLVAHVVTDEDGASTLDHTAVDPGEDVAVTDEVLDA